MRTSLFYGQRFKRVSYNVATSMRQLVKTSSILVVKACAIVFLGNHMLSSDSLRWSGAKSWSHARCAAVLESFVDKAASIECLAGTCSQGCAVYCAVCGQTAMGRSDGEAFAMAVSRREALAIRRSWWQMQLMCRRVLVRSATYQANRVRFAGDCGLEDRRGCWRHGDLTRSLGAAGFEVLGRPVHPVSRSMRMDADVRIERTNRRLRVLQERCDGCQ